MGVLNVRGAPLKSEPRQPMGLHFSFRTRVSTGGADVEASFGERLEEFNLGLLMLD